MKNKKYIFVIIGVLLLLISLVSVCLFFSFGKNEKVDKPKKEDEEVEIREGYDEFGNKLVVVYETKDEVYDVIVNKYLKKDETITFTKEENGCWYYTSSNGIDEYIYCIDNPLIRVRSTYRVNIPAK